MKGFVRLGDVTSSASTWIPAEYSPEDKFTYVDISSINAASKRIVTPTTVAVSAAPSRARQMLESGDVLVSTVRPNLNAVAVVPPELNGAIGSTGFAVLRPDTAKIDGRYLFHWVRAPSFVRGLIARATGASYPAVTGSVIRESKVPLPALAEQFRIAEMLDKADEVSRKRQESLRLLDEFLRSAFLQMFGDPVGNERGWELRAIAEVAKVTTGNTPPRSHPEYYGASIEWIKSDNINTAEPYLTRASEGLSPVGRRVARTAAPGAVLMTCIAGSRKCIGNVALAGREVAFNQQINAVEPSLGVDSRFLYVLFRVGKRLVQQASTDSMKGMVTKGRLEHVKVIHPPIDLQNRFGEWFNRWHTARSRQRQALESSEMLFHSIAHGAFEGAQ